MFKTSRAKSGGQAKTRIAYLVSHPIQYQAPLLRQIAAQNDIDLTVFFASDFSVHRHIDKDFQKEINWDVDLLSGYRHEFLPPFLPLRAGEAPNFWRPFGGGLFSRLKAGQFDVVWIHGFHRAAHLLAIFYAKILGIKIMLRDEPAANSAARSLGKILVKRAVFSVLTRMVDQFLAIGTANLEYWQELGVPKAKITLMPYAVDNDFFRQNIAQMRQANTPSPRRKLGLADSALIVLFVGKLIPRKRPLDLIQALKIVNQTGKNHAGDIHLVLAGDGELRSELAQAAQKLGLAQRVHITGFQSQAELAGWYDCADILALPSERETWGLVVNEAMNGGLALLLSDRIGSGRDLLRAGENGYSYCTGHIKEIAHCLTLLTHDRQHLAQMGEVSRALIEKWDFAADIAGLRQALGKIFRR
ncbi:MAG: glycosyltransferase family 4 protein [Alphaproteobacteria bacterium]|nr:glycosyltransferase family 4 protein [Alphaproteobacteria bacterium]